MDQVEAQPIFPAHLLPVAAVHQVKVTKVEIHPQLMNLAQVAGVLQRQAVILLG